MTRIRVKSGNQKGEEYPLDQDPFLIGRSEKANLQVLDEGASREHAEIFRIGNACFIEDLDSTNNTILNDQVVEQEELLQPGDRIQIGTTILVFEDSDSEQEDGGGHAEQMRVKEQSSQLGAETMEIPLEETTPEKRSIQAVGEERESRSLMALYQIGKLLSEEKEVEELLDGVLSLVAETVPADGAYIFLINDAGKLKPAASYLRDTDNNGTASGVSRTIIKRVLRTSRSVLTSDAEEDERFSGSQSVVMKGIKSVIAAPITGFGDLQGVLYLFSNKAEGAFSTEDLELITAVGIQTGVAVSEMSATERMKVTMKSAVKMLVRAVEAKEPRTRGHSERVAGFCTAIGQQLDLSASTMETLQLAALLHDVGKIVDHDEMPAEYKELNEKAAHVEMGVRIVREADIFEEMIPGIQYHHVYVDGTGYPDGVEGDDIPAWVHILIVANAFDNLLHHPGTGGEGIPVKSVIEDIRQRVEEGHFRADVVTGLEKAYQDGTLFETDPSVEAFLS